MKTKITLRLALFCLFAALISCSACKKVNEEDEKKASEFRAFTSAKKFKITHFYSDKPVDYEENDNEVKQETDLWVYVKDYIRDDINIVDNNQVQIQQNAIKLPGSDAVTLTRPFNVGADRSGAYLEFVDYFYEPLRYKLFEFKDNYFIIYVDFKGGAKLFSKYELVP